jgi:hypothetical protein
MPDQIVPQVVRAEARTYLRTKIKFFHSAFQADPLPQYAGARVRRSFPDTLNRFADGDEWMKSNV